MNKSCFVAPIHSAKFNHGLCFIQSYNNYYEDDHIFLVFSSHEEKDQFSELANGLRYRSIVCDSTKNNPQPFSPLDSGIITEKKYYGLNHVFSTTDFENVGVVDVDCDFFKTVDYDDLFTKYNQRKTLWGSLFHYDPDDEIIEKFSLKVFDDYEKHLFKTISVSPEKFFSDDDKEKLIELTRDFRIYFWFNDIPVYNKNYFLDFMQYINYENRSHELTWYDFDFVLYGYYLLLKCGFTYNIIVRNNVAMLECQHIIHPDDFSEVFNICKPMWIKKDIQPEYMEQTFMHVHLDRL